MNVKKNKKNIKKKEFYICRVKCSNCGWGYLCGNDMEIPKELTEKEWSQQTKCPQCHYKGVLYIFGGCVQIITENNKIFVKPAEINFNN